ncbi:MAG: tellurium resistance protein [Paracoccaceae bacterium]
MLKPTPRAKFGEATPPAIFPPIFGLLGLGLAWRAAVDVFDVPPGVAQFILGAVTLLFLFSLVAYTRKVIRRPGVVAEDLRVLPGLAGLAAMVLAVYLLAAALLPLSTAAARVALFAGAALHLGLFTLVLHGLATGPAAQRQVTPVWHLTFAGIIFAPVAAVPLGYQAASLVILYAAGGIAVPIWAASLVQLARRDPPPPLRPLLAIHLAPASLLGSVALILGHERLATGCAWFAGLILAALLIRARYVTVTGFNPLWGAFTFPLAAFATLMLHLAAAGQGEGYRVVGAVALVAGTLIIPAIAVKVMKGWAKGDLAAKTNAARA